MVHAAGLDIDFTEANISARSIHVGGAMALLMERVEPDAIRLLGRWQRDTMLRYLHMTDKIFTEGMAVKIFQHGKYALIHPMHAVN